MTKIALKICRKSLHTALHITKMLIILNFHYKYEVFFWDTKIKTSSGTIAVSVSLVNYYV